MPEIILFDDPEVRARLLPLTYTRPVAKIRCGIKTIDQKWSDMFFSDVSFRTEHYLSEKFPAKYSDDTLYIHGGICPNDELISALRDLNFGESLFSEQNELLAVRTGPTWQFEDGVQNYKSGVYTGPLTLIRNIWDIFSFNGLQIKADFERITASAQSQPVSDPFTRCYHPEQIFIEPGAVIKASVLNAENGPIYIGRNALIQEGSMIQGPFAIGESSVLAQGTKIRPNTTVGPFCKVGGEVSNCVIFGYSNKGHDGYLGNSVIGEWCNLGANTNNSNLKNDHTSVKLHNYLYNTLADTGLLFCGVFMGDYSKAGISTMFNTGTVVGVSVNVFGAGFQNKHIPSFSWGGAAEGSTEYRFPKALEVAKDTVGRRGVGFGETDEKLLRHIFEQTQMQRPI